MRLFVVLAMAACTPRSALDAPSGGSNPWLREGSSCMVCHDRLTTPTGEDVSFGSLWQSSIMANSARDPYWQAAVRRETVDHPRNAAAIEEQCSRCHMPMANEQARIANRRPEVFANLAEPLAMDGVACSVCHQITPAKLGDPSSFSGEYVLDRGVSWARMFGPFDISAERTSLMRSTLGVVPERGDHIQSSELCATCHTLYTEALDDNGRQIGRFPEQVPYLEWLQSDYRASGQTCQRCHMPTVDTPMPITSVLGIPRPGLSRHDFRGANFFMLGILAAQGAELGVVASLSSLEVAAAQTRSFLEESTARVRIEAMHHDGGKLTFDVVVENLAGHKLPTAYPSRRAWLHVKVLDRSGGVRFESGKLAADGSIIGNDNDADKTRFERHYTEIHAADEVQIYEPILGDPQGRVTTGLTSATQYLKDNRLLPTGFAKSSAHADTAVRGEALDDPDFVGGGDRIRYAVDAGDGPVAVEVELVYQPIGYRWAHNLEPYTAHDEPRRFLGYFKTMARGSAHVLATARADDGGHL